MLFQCLASVADSDKVLNQEEVKIQKSKIPIQNSYQKTHNQNSNQSVIGLIETEK